MRVNRPAAGQLGFRLRAAGRATGALFGRFTFDEQGRFVIRSGEGANEGIMTISRPDGGQAVIRFSGQATIWRVTGDWQVLSATGTLSGITGGGRYTGNAGLLFKVTFQPAAAEDHGQVRRPPEV